MFLLSIVAGACGPSLFAGEKGYESKKKRKRFAQNYLVNYKRALVTGGAGLIGSHIADGLVVEGIEEIVVLDNLSRGRRQNLELVMASGRGHDREGDIRNAELVARAYGRH